MKNLAAAGIFALGIVIALLWESAPRTGLALSSSSGPGIEVSTRAEKVSVSSPGPATVAARNQPASAAPNTSSALRSSEKLMGGLAAWGQRVCEPAGMQFARWTETYVLATAEEKPGLEAEGVRLAASRRAELADLLQQDPERALASAVPEEVRTELPRSVQPLLEQKINAVGDYEVLCVLPLEEGKTAPLVRSAKLDGVVHRVFTFGKAIDYVSRRGVWLNGIAVPAEAAGRLPEDPAGINPRMLMALNPNPARMLSTSELSELQARVGAEQVCTITGRPWLEGGTPTALELGGQTFFFSTMALADGWVAEQIAAAALDTPEAPGNLPTAESSYTEGRKRFLLMRVDFPDFPGDAMSTNTALNLMNNMGVFLAAMSYNKHTFAAVGEGTDITPTMRMSTNASAYDNAGLSKLYPEAKDVAETVYGYDLSKYDFLFVCTGSRPSYGYAGLGYVGGVGFHLANGYFDVRTGAHEFGHNLGLGHANWWNSPSMIGPGTSDEYGDSFDTMGGSGGGVRHFSSHFKARLNWIPGTDVLTVSTSGVYRLYAHDLTEAPVGLRCIHLDRSGDDYALEYRQLWTGNKAMMNGVPIRWGGGSSILLDMQPGSAAGKDDHPLTIGRTFSDPGLNYHVTVLRKAHTFPESVDVAINVGSFPYNAPPVLKVAQTPAAAVGQTVNFSASATDPNGDALAWHWDFGDGDYSIDNSPSTTHTFGSIGEYCVECTVSDMKGGTARESILVRIGSPTTFTIGGRILDENGKPVQGVRVYTDTSHYAFTESDGTYTITRLSGGSYTVRANEPVYGTNTFSQPFFDNPVVVGPSFTTADFILVKSSAQLYLPLVATRSYWKYLDDGSDQQDAWRTPDFDDSNWKTGKGILGYGETYIATNLTYGPDANNKYITYYFRQAVVVTNLAGLTNLQLQVLRDDGVVVYFNGIEVYRSNMPGGTPTYQTLASDSGDGEANTNSYFMATLPTSTLRDGTNVIAAEVHQASLNSSDLVFDLGLRGLSSSNATRFMLVYVAQPSYNQQFTSPTNILITAFAKSAAASVSRVDFYADGLKIGESDTEPYTALLTNPTNGPHTLQVVANLGSLSVTSAPVKILVAEPVPPPPAPLTLSLVPMGSAWKYLAGPTNAATGWQNPGFDDGSWASGTAQLGYGGDGEVTVLPYGGNSANKWMTYYFRRLRVINDPAAVTNLTIQLRRDDGAVVYLNGQEVIRDNMPVGAIDWATPAVQAAPDDGNELLSFEISPALLQVGYNTVAVEVHQSDPGSSDVTFDLGMTAIAFTNRAPGVWLSEPAEGAVIEPPATVRLEAAVVVGSVRSVERVEFFADGSKLGETTSSPYTFVWQDPPGGVQVKLWAVATDNVGTMLTSAPVRISISAPPLGSALVSFGESWKYLDDGSDQGTAWVAANFNDRAWLMGPAKLGYGGDGEVTTIGFGTNSGQRYITSYYRKRFNIASQPISRLLLQLVADDGAVVYLNGREVYRRNMLEGQVSFNSLALQALGEPSETAVVNFELSPSNLRVPTNVLAVELHQASTTSSDAGFDLALWALKDTNMVEGIYLVNPPDGARFGATTDIELSAYAVTQDPLLRVEYFDGTIKIGEASASPFRFAWETAAVGTHTVTARAITSGGAFTSPAVSIFVDPAPRTISPVLETLLEQGSDWKYWDNAAGVAANWQSPVFDDGLWPSGPARFGYGWDGEITQLTQGRVTTYFRKWITVNNPAVLTDLAFHLVRDDGAVVYLNGRELYRSNMPEGPVGPETMASTTVNTPEETTFLETILPTLGSGLLSGSNLLAVEVHQSSETSSDLGFDMQLSAYGTTERRNLLLSPADHASYSQTSVILVEAAVSPGEGASVLGVEIVVDGAPLAELTAAPYRWSWSGPAFGAHTLMARASFSDGIVLDSAPVSVEIGREPIVNTLITPNAVWRYLANGSNQGTNWSQPTFIDSAWDAGEARLGYGGDGEATTLSFGPDANNKYITTYFRRSFVVQPNAVYTNLTFNLVRDDGAVVWLNGRELYRSNMPVGSAIAYNTLASSAVSGADEQRFFLTSLSVSNVVAGTNIVAVEVHQNAGSSSDLGFALEVVGKGYIQEAVATHITAALADGNLEVSWPDDGSGWQLYYSTALSGPASGWSPVLNADPVLVNGKYTVTIAPASESQFFRLFKP